MASAIPVHTPKGEQEAPKATRKSPTKSPKVKEDPKAPRELADGTIRKDN